MPVTDPLATVPTWERKGVGAALMVVLASCTLLLLHAYIGYPLVMWAAARDRRSVPTTGVPQPIGHTVLLIAAHNEAPVIGTRIENALRVRPHDMKVVVVSDGSTDDTDAIVTSYTSRDPRVELLRVDERLGKNHALNCAVRILQPSPETVLVFSDATTMFREDAVVHLRQRLADGASCVAGQVVFTDAESGTARSEGVYWRYETTLKSAEGALGRLPFGSGAILAVKSADLPELPLDVGNDFWIPVTALTRHKRVEFEPRAIAWEGAPHSAADEFARKVRVANRSMRGVMTAWSHADPLTRFQLVSHKVIRWLGIPLLLTAAVSAALLGGVSPVFYGLAALFLAPIGLGGLALVAERAGVRFPGGELAAHFLLVHWAAMLGVAEALSGRGRATWQRTEAARVGRHGGNERLPAAAESERAG